MAKTVTIEGMSAAITEILNEYGEMTISEVREASQRVAKEGVRALKSSSGQFGGTGKYARGWTTTSEGGRFDTTVTIHNRTPGLPHLLENGHALRNGGRTSGRTHIAPVEQELITKFEKELRANL